MKQEKILVTGALGQIGSDLITELSKIYGASNVISTDIKPPSEANVEGTYIQLDVNDSKHWRTLLNDFSITQIYHLAALLSATAEQFPTKGWEINTSSLVNLLEFAKNEPGCKVFWPSSIAVFGEGIDRRMAKQYDPQNPITLYGIAKSAGERLCAYYYEKFNVDVRSLRYPGLISWKTRPGGGTTDYAVQIYYDAIEKGRYECFLTENTRLPMLYMDDAIRATIELMQAERESLTVDEAYNIGGLSFTPIELAASIQKEIPDFKISYAPDYRQNIADSWPENVDDSAAQKDWNWKPNYNLDEMTQVMLSQLSKKLKPA